MSRIPQIKNRTPAPIQITSEQLLREAHERGIEDVTKAPKQFITDKEELLQYQQNKRKDFEDQIRRSRHHIGIWCRYALWEASQKEFERARSVFERALDVDYKNQTLWMKYAEMEMKNKFINHARNIWDRAVTLHPRVDNYWYKFSYMEEMVGAVESARQIFERWMDWEPDDMAWGAFIKFEMRQGNVDKARDIYERYIRLHPTARAYLKYAKWEESLYQKSQARQVYERSLNELHPYERSEKLLLNFAKFEERCKEVDRARVIFQYAINQAKEKANEAEEKEEDNEVLNDLKREFIAFEKRHGSKERTEDVIIQQRREQYEKILKENCYDYDTWMDYIRLEEVEGNSDLIRSVYDRATNCIPLVKEKRYWRRYIYLWINYAIFEELTQKDIEKAREVYKRCLGIIPHKVFTFGKIWMLAAQLEVRQRDLVSARKLLGQGIGISNGKKNIIKGYIELELQLGEIERCRTLYGKFIEFLPYNCDAWLGFAKLETDVGETARARAIYALAVNQADLDMPERIWKSFIDFEISEGNVDNARNLYEQLVERTNHVKVWISFAKFENEFGLNAENEENIISKLLERISRVRAIYERGYETLKRQGGMKEERVLLLEAWKDDEKSSLQKIELSMPDENEEMFVTLEEEQKKLQYVEAKFPKKVKMSRTLYSPDGSTEIGTEDYYDYIFPDDEKKIVGLKILEKAMAWKSAIATNEETNIE